MPDAAPHIEVLGFDCGACRKTHRLLVAAAERLGVPARIDKVSDPARIAGAPGVSGRRPRCPEHRRLARHVA